MERGGGGKGRSSMGGGGGGGSPWAANPYMDCTRRTNRRRIATSAPPSHAGHPGQPSARAVGCCRWSRRDEELWRTKVGWRKFARSGLLSRTAKNDTRPRPKAAHRVEVRAAVEVNRARVGAAVPHVFHAVVRRVEALWGKPPAAASHRRRQHAHAGPLSADTGREKRDTPRCSRTTLACRTRTRGRCSRPPTS